ncbi:MAG: hypothetical protein LBS50_00510 [Prevotellaceae bacterium]|jgi:hypothetical protein|nr:hypothetical protein [Prevotellaceae bacterium]
MEISPFLVNFGRQTKKLNQWAKIQILADSRTAKEQKEWEKLLYMMDSTVSFRLFTPLSFILIPCQI